MYDFDDEAAADVRDEFKKIKVTQHDLCSISTFHKIPIMHTGILD